MDWTIMSAIKDTLQTYLPAALTFIGTKYTITLENVLTENYIIAENQRLINFPSIYIFSPSRDMVGERLVWGEDQGDEWVGIYYIDMFCESDDPEDVYKQVCMYIEAIRKVLRENDTLGNESIQGSIITNVGFSNLMQGEQNLHMGARITYRVVAWEFDKFPMTVT